MPSYTKDKAGKLTLKAKTETPDQAAAQAAELAKAATAAPDQAPEKKDTK
jgi:hypothetical protein